MRLVGGSLECKVCKAWVLTNDSLGRAVSVDFVSMRFSGHGMCSTLMTGGWRVRV